MSRWGELAQAWADKRPGAEVSMKINSSLTPLIFGGSVTLKDLRDGYIWLFARARAEAANGAVIHVTQRRVA